MLRQAKIMLLANIALGITFLFSNYYIWNWANQPAYTSTGWGPINFEIVPKNPVDGVAVPQIAFSVFNYPFWLFWLTVAVNFFFIIKIARNKEPNT